MEQRLCRGQIEHDCSVRRVALPSGNAHDNHGVRAKERDPQRSRQRAQAVDVARGICRNASAELKLHETCAVNSARENRCNQLTHQNQRCLSL